MGFLTDFCQSLQNEQKLKTILDRGRAMPTQCTKRLIIKSTIFNFLNSLCKRKETRDFNKAVTLKVTGQDGLSVEGNIFHLFYI